MFKSSQVTRTLEKFLSSYGWGVIDNDDYLDHTIQPGEFVRFYDDEMDSWNYGVYLGWYQDLSKSGDTSPYFSEAYEGIDRLVMQDSVINPDGTLTTRTNYALPENVYGLYEVQSAAFKAVA